ncbi:hypothetical protein [Halodesulfovibrio sp. MK-HDV]|jgi:hypothetical protein|uniref:hypothetical protein n=1 Tax=Halodesulfovibrio sp. MK-HDV TaxID=2599925 RepID=UPI00136F2372|nr:hypothetical protein [Halodesulfovibrio sp. MK-HDV]KAF1074703.1 hypothetical protein MKHDV_02497 [Halodesulfovibrio sp. MK-HDV]
MSVEVIADECDAVSELEYADDDNMRFSTYTFVNVTTNEQYDFDYMVLEESLVIKGGLVVFILEPDKPRFYTVELVDDTNQRVELTKAKNGFSKILLLFALLGASWFVLDYIMKFFF